MNDFTRSGIRKTMPFRIKAQPGPPKNDTDSTSKLPPRQCERLIMIERAFNLHVKHLLCRAGTKVSSGSRREGTGSSRPYGSHDTKCAIRCLRRPLPISSGFAWTEIWTNGSSSLQAAAESTPLPMQLVPQDTGFNQLNFGRHSPFPSLPLQLQFVPRRGLFCLDNVQFRKKNPPNFDRSINLTKV
jgi:hypothetical protein